MNSRLMALVLVVGLSYVSVLSAHHRWPVNRESHVTVTGTVTSFTWANPHPMIELEVEGANGTTETWLVGGPALNRMERNGWSPTTVQQGDVITGIGFQFADGSRVVRLDRVVLADGREIFVYGRR